jgi:ribonuclease E
LFARDLCAQSPDRAPGDYYMTTRMLIDARHREETRVAIVKGNRIEEFDFESAEHKQLKGNIYLAKVTRVEPSLQAAFVDYGGNRHGFLAFSEIHPDYYQIPKEDRDALLREEAEHAAEEAALRAGDEDDDEDEDFDDGHEPDEESVERFDDDGGPDEEVAAERESKGRKPKRKASDDAVEALRERRTNLRHRYKIQDVIRRRQVLLVQVVKEERGNKGAALTTYLSLAGRYCVLMPNTSHGGGISRKINSAADRKRLKSIMADMQLPPTMGCIVRTAGLQRTKVEIKRDFDYLARLWDGIREKTLTSAAPALVYGDSDLIKRAIRDIYNKEIDEVIVEGDDGYRHAREFMKLLMPTHARRVKHYADAVPLYQRAGVEEQLSAMYHPVVQLKSGGYLVINPTEALVSIDINSGRSTREHSIESTATATNLEAAHEIARQLRLRDMAGLVVIDFIDMDNGSNVRKVEKAMKEALKNDRARIQVGRISSFGLMEMSRQRLRTGVLEASTRQCPHCEGTGLVRTASSSGLSALRLIEDEAARGRGSILTLSASQEAALYVLNRKRADIAEIEERYGVNVVILSDGEPEGSRMSVEASGPPPAYAPKFEALVEPDEDDIIEEEFDEEEVEEPEAEEEEAPRAREPREPRAPREDRPREERPEGATDDSHEGRRGRRRRRGRRGRPRIEGEEGVVQAPNEASDLAETYEDDIVEEAPRADEAPRSDEPAVAGEESGEARRRRGRRGRRGGARRAEGGAREQDVRDEGAIEAGVAAQAEQSFESTLVEDEPEAAPVAAEAPKRGRRRPRARVGDAPAPVVAKPKREPVVAAPVVEAPVVEAPVVEAPVAEAPVAEEAPVKAKRKPRKKAEPVVEAPVVEEAPAKPKRKPRKKAVAEDTAEAPVAPVADPEPAAPVEAEAETAADAEGGTRRGGWWQRTFGQ